VLILQFWWQRSRPRRSGLVLHRHSGLLPAFARTPSRHSRLTPSLSCATSAQSLAGIEGLVLRAVPWSEIDLLPRQRPKHLAPAHAHITANAQRATIRFPAAPRRDELPARRRRT
jgi:hypothetical protein